MFTTIDSRGKAVKIASQVNQDGEHQLVVAGGSTGGGASGQATEAKQDSILNVLGDILSELQTLNAALVTANQHLAVIEANTTPSGGGG